jgi:hypothetical protein
MSYFPDCRTDEYYNEKYLIQADKEVIRGYDWCVEQVMCAFANIDEWTFRDELDVRPSDVVKAVEAMEPWFKRWLESDRNELITSMLDDMDEEEYKKRKQEVDNKKAD